MDHWVGHQIEVHLKMRVVSKSTKLTCKPCYRKPLPFRDKWAWCISLSKTWAIPRLLSTVELWNEILREHFTKFQASKLIPFDVQVRQYTSHALPAFPQLSSSPFWELDELKCWEIEENCRVNVLFLIMARFSIHTHSREPCWDSNMAWGRSLLRIYPIFCLPKLAWCLWSDPIDLLAYRTRIWCTSI